MKATILLETKNDLRISWSDNKLGFGELTMKWDEKQRAYILDSELMNVSTIIKIFKNAEKPSLDVYSSIKEKFLEWYLEMPENELKSAYYFEGRKDGPAIKGLIKKIEFKIKNTGTHDITEKNIISGFAHILNNVSDTWLRNNMSLALLNSKFNQIFTQQNNGQQQLNNLQKNIQEGLGEL